MTKAYILRTCNADMTSHSGFKWPVSGPVEAPDWDATDRCGGGLHGLLGGVGNGSLLNWAPGAKWLVVEVEASDVVAITRDGGGKVKFPRGEVIFAGERFEAVEKLMSYGVPNIGVVSGTATAGDRGTATAGHSGTATAGDRGTATAGYSGTATAGDSGTATAGDRGTATAGHSGTATAGDRGTATAGYSGTATAGDSGTATAGYSGTATAGYSGTATAGDRGTATAGDRGTATAGDRGTATAGENGTLCILWYDAKKNQYRRAIAAVGEKGIKPNTKYRVTEIGKFEEVNP